MKKLLTTLLVVSLGLITSCGPIREQGTFDTNAVLNDGSDVAIHVWVDYNAHVVGAADSMHKDVENALRDRLLQCDYPEFLNDATPIIRDALKDLPRTSSVDTAVFNKPYTITNVVVKTVLNTDTIQVTLYQ
jgi:hypothetical protein